MKQKHFIDSHKGATGLFVLFLMWYFEQWQNSTAWIYMAMHGGYGLLWVLKSRYFPDRSWEKPCGLAYGFVIWGALSLYWVTPYLIMQQEQASSPFYVSACLLLFIIGIFYHFAADMQKYVQLKLQPGKLITSELFRNCRNPNYFGELLIYLGFNLLAMHWLPLVFLACFISFVWIPNMIKKDRSLSRYPEFQEYKSRSSLFWPLKF